MKASLISLVPPGLDCVLRSTEFSHPLNAGARLHHVVPFPTQWFEEGDVALLDLVQSTHATNKTATLQLFSALVRPQAEKLDEICYVAPQI